LGSIISWVGQTHQHAIFILWLWSLPAPTKILEGGTKEEIRIFEALFKGMSTRFGLRTLEKCFENPDFFFCFSLQNLRLGSIQLS
jgi:hypothetical protein